MTAGDPRSRSSPTPTAEPLAYVFKTIADPYVGQISLFKVLSRHDPRPTTTCSTPAPGTDERLHALFTLAGPAST